MTAKSYIQTVEVLFPNSSNVFLTMKMAPPRIEFYSKEETMKALYNDDMDTYWEPDGTITIHYHDSKVVEKYHPKPTLNDVITKTHTTARTYFREHMNGSVEQKRKDQYYFWGQKRLLSGINITI